MGFTLRPRSWVGLFALAVLVAGCSREQQDWRSAEAADTVEAYGHFIRQHPDSELTRQARTRVSQLGEEHDWQHALSADTPAAYRHFMTQHPVGRRAEEARIRIEALALARGGVVPPGAGPQPPDAGSSTAEASSSDDAKGPISAERHTEPHPSAAHIAPASVPPGKNAGYAVQLGAYRNRQGADTAWKTLSARFTDQLQGLSERVVGASTSTGAIYRLQAGVADEARARAICATLRQRAQGCLPVLLR